MGGHVAEKLIIGDTQVSSGCGNDLQGATKLAYRAVRHYGMYGENAGYTASKSQESSEKRNAEIDK